MKFLTKDKDKDEWKDNCVKERKGAWWYKRCFDSSLNDVYYQNPKILPAPPPDHGIQWQTWKDDT